MNYTLHTYEDRYESVKNIDVSEYPSHELLFNGVGLDKGFSYVSSTYLNGLINYAKVLNAFMSFEYGYDDKESTLQKLESISEKEWYHTNLGQFSESITVIGELDDSYVTFMYDADVSDCCIFRYSKRRHSYEEVLEDTLGKMKSYQEFEDPKCNEYVELPLPKGWIKY